MTKEAYNKRKITRKAFEQELAKKHKKLLYRAVYKTTESGYVVDIHGGVRGKIQTLHLYYLDETQRIHIGAWSSGEGWEFPVGE